MTIVGAGVVGLTCAIALAERGHHIDVLAMERLGTTSDVAASLWALPSVEQSDRVRAWALDTRARLLAEGSESAGIRTLRLTTIAISPFPADPWMGEFLPRAGFRPSEELPTGYGFGPYAETLLIDTSRFLPWLRGRLLDLGGTFRDQTVSSPDDVPGEGPVVIAAGVGSGRIVGDGTLSQREASVIRVSNPGLVDATIVRDGPLAPLFVVPRFDDVVLGGGDPGEHPESVLARAAEVEHRLAGARILSVAHGARPMRADVRVDTIMRRRRRIVCCYGHGGAGFATCWGTAQAVVEQVEAA